MIYSLLKKLAFLLCFTAIVGNIVVHQGQLKGHLPNLLQTTESRCYRVFVDSFKAGESKGIWSCMSEDMKQVWFSANGWQEETDITKWLQVRITKGYSFTVLEYKGNPIKTCKVTPSGSQVCSRAYLIFLETYIRTVNPDNGAVETVLSVQLSTSYTLTMDKAGYIDNIQ